MAGNHRKKHHNRHSNKKQSQEKQEKEKENPLQLPICSVCGKAIRNLTTAIAAEKDNSPVHFECILKKLTEQETLGNNEKICYLGGGSFGIVRQKPGSGSKHFFIRKRIQVEAQDSVLEWRKDISKSLL
jgi:hypothetical protein